MDALTHPKRKPGLRAPRRPRAPPASKPTRPYPDLHDHVRALEKAGQLIRVDRPINKDTEMHPLVRWQFRGGIEEKDRKAFLFTNVTDCKGRKYDIPVLVGGLAANREIYRIGIGCEFAEIDARWVKAAQQPAAAARRHQGAVPRHRHHRRGPRQAGPGPRRHPAADLDAGLGRRALRHAVAVHHQGPRHRRAEHGQLPRPGEGAAAARHEPVAGVAPGHLQPLGKAARPRLQEAAVRRGARRAAVHHLRLGAEAAGDARRAARRRRAGRRADQRGEGQDRRPAGAGRGRDRDRGFHRHRVSRARGAVRRDRTATSISRSSTPSWTSPPSRGGRTPS